MSQNLNKVKRTINRDCYTIKESYTTLQSQPETRHGDYFSSLSAYEEEGQYTKGQRSGVWINTSRGRIVQKYDFDNHKELEGDKSQLLDRITIIDPSNGTSKNLPIQNIYLGGDTKMKQVLVSCVRYPAEAQQKNITGKVRIRFLISADGKVTNEVALTNLGGGLEAEALRVFRLMPQDWLPVYVDGKAVDTEVEILFGFKLS